MMAKSKVSNSHSNARHFTVFQSGYRIFSNVADDTSTDSATATEAPVAVPTRLSPMEVYTRELLVHGRGYPLWQPKPAENMPEAYRKEGVRIGDVGFLDESGGFFFLFNVCLPADDPVNVRRVPREFEPIPGLDHHKTACKEYPPNWSVACGSEALHHVQGCMSAMEATCASGLSFTSSASQGAVLIMPEGGRKEDHEQHQKFAQYAVEYAHAWYQHVEDLGLGISNGSMYLVTGCDKTRAWGVASFTNVHPESPVFLDFRPLSTAENQRQIYRFTRSDSATSASGADNIFNAQSGCVFLRGFRIAIQKRSSRRTLKTICKSFMRAANISPGQWKSKKNNHFKNNFSTSSQVYHPSDAINRWILNNYPWVDVAITHDNDWVAVIQQTDCEFPPDKVLVQRLSKHLHISRLLDKTDCFFATYEMSNQPAVNLSAVGQKLSVLEAQENGKGNALHPAVKNESIDAAVRAKMSNENNSNNHSGHNEAAVYATATKGSAYIIAYLPQKEADLNSQREIYGYKLQAAVHHDKLDSVKYISIKGASINAQGGALQAIGSPCPIEYPMGQATNVTLQASVHHGKLPRVYLLKEGTSFNAQGGEYGNSLQAVINNGNLCPFIDSGEKDMDVNTYTLHVGVHYGKLASAIYFGEGISINTQGVEHEHILQAIIKSGSLCPASNHLVENGTDVNTQGENYVKAIQMAPNSGTFNLVVYLMDKNINFNAVGGKFGNALSDKIGYVMEQDDDIAVDGRSNENVIHSDKLAIFGYILEHSADINTNGGSNGNALHASASVSIDTLDIARCLLDQGTSIHSDGRSNRHILYASASGNKLDLMEYTWDQGADINADGRSSRNTLFAAVNGDQLDVIEYILEQSADTKADNGSSASAAENDSIDFIGYIVEQGADINDNGGSKGNALYVASAAKPASSNTFDIVSSTLEQGADINANGRSNGNILFAAANGNKFDIVVNTLKAGVGINAGCRSNDSELHAAAASSNKLDAVVYILKQNADVSADSRSNENAAACHSSLDIARDYLKEGAEIDTLDGQHMPHGHADSVWPVRFSPEGARVVSDSNDVTVRIWNVTTGTQIGHSICSVGSSPDGARIWDAATRVQIGDPLHSHGDSAWSKAAVNSCNSQIVKPPEDFGATQGTAGGDILPAVAYNSLINVRLLACYEANSNMKAKESRGLVKVAVSTSMVKIARILYGPESIFHIEGIPNKIVYRTAADVDSPGIVQLLAGHAVQTQIGTSINAAVIVHIFDSEANVKADRWPYENALNAPVYNSNSIFPFLLWLHQFGDAADAKDRLTMPLRQSLLMM
ncbi:hypothetical protein GYMLUDRAFT_266261 [Collybiopsis luxurians FD-317 M1]|uniref:Uncharacterized protein n=1 Tax=Collybiopsis luxurians FD-317 M1 TaxID=944289 RepID=A0A0D0AIQ3_9AGAR|nr:hypothetical protein GYMLUDRAFT_266261 [Collybiopsis luxurians FD-317 M1]